MMKAMGLCSTLGSSVCRATCDLCDASPDLPLLPLPPLLPSQNSSSCDDASGADVCADLKEKGKCESLGLSICKKTCDFCAKAAANASTNASICEDFSPACQTMKTGGLCSTSGSHLCRKT